jgi:hypothetical protein
MTKTAIPEYKSLVEIMARLWLLDVMSEMKREKEAGATL